MHTLEPGEATKGRVVGILGALFEGPLEAVETF